MLRGVEHGSVPDPLQRTAFRSSWTQPEGISTPTIIEGKVVDINLALWTVDVISQFDSKWYLNVQVASPYLHSNRGEGIFVMPEIGAKCHICIPSDGPPPFVLDFIMPHETSESTATDSTDQTGVATFAGGRVRAKPGDIYIKGRDGNFVILHRGGVLQIGATELAQRIYIPLTNLVSDISQNYRHYNTGGSINWFVASAESEINPPTIRKDTYRLLAGDERATIRVAYGPLKDVLSEQSTGAISDLNQLKIGTEEDGPIVLEVAIAPDGFGADNGSINESTSKQTVLRYFFDKKGNAFMRSEGSVFLMTRKKLRVVCEDNIDIRTKKSFTLKVEKTARIDGGDLLELNGKVTKINGGSHPAAFLGSVVQVRISLPLVSTPSVPGSPVVIPPINPLTGQPQVINGTIISGNSTILI